MLIYVCVSGHGYGHGSRVAAVLTVLHRLEPSWRLVLSTPLAPAFLDLALGPVPFDHRPCRWDVGVVQADALGADGPATLEALAALEAALPALVAQEAEWLAHQHEPVLVLADVPPAAARLATDLQLPLVWMGNFGWDTIYRPMGGELMNWADGCLADYRRGLALLHCPFDLPMDWGVPHHMLGLTAGRPRHPAGELRQLLQLEAPRERTVMMTFGGMGFPLDPQLFLRWPHHTFLVSDSQWLQAGPNVRLLPAHLRPLEALPLCGRIVTKPGYSTCCEALVAGVGVHLVRREGFAEAPVLEAVLAQHGQHRLLSRGQLLAGDWQLDQPLLPPSIGPLPTDGDAMAAELLQRYAQQFAAMPQGPGPAQPEL